MYYIKTHTQTLEIENTLEKDLEEDANKRKVEELRWSDTNVCAYT